MSKKFYSESEELNFEGSLNDFDYLFKGFIYKPPTLKEALLDMFENAGLSEEDAKELYDHLYKMCDQRVQDKWNLIKQDSKFGFSKNDALIISSYTYEPMQKFKEYSPYRLLNTNLVATDRKKGVINVEKYLFLFLRALRGCKICSKKVLFRCIPCKVKVEKDPNNNKYVPYQKGLEKIFWPFTSTSDDENIAERFLDNGKGTKFRIESKYRLWGYDISLFNVCNEKEILLEPERKYIIENIKEESNVTEVTLKIIDNPLLLENCEFYHKLVCNKCGSENIDSNNDLLGLYTGEKCKDCGNKFFPLTSFCGLGYERSLRGNIDPSCPVM